MAGRNYPNESPCRRLLRRPAWRREPAAPVARGNLPYFQRTGRTFVNLNAGRDVAVRFTHIYDVLNVAGGRLFSAHVPELRMVYQRDLRTLVRVILQYTDVTRDSRLYATPVARESRDLFGQLLVSYKVNPQTAIYFGYITGAGATDRFALRQSNRTLFAKVSYAWLR